MDLRGGERVLGFARSTDGSWVVATTQALWLTAPRPRRIEWTAIDSARWVRETQSLLVVETAPVGRLAPTVDIRFDTPTGLVDVVRERVTACVVTTRRVDIRGSRGVRVVGRRPAWAPGEPIRWSVSVDRGLDVTDEQVKAQIDEVLALARAEVGE